MSRYGTGLLDRHPAAGAGTDREPVDLEQSGATSGITMRPRAAGGFYQVVRCAGQGNNWPIYRVLHGALIVGTQASNPSAEDCTRLERERAERVKAETTGPRKPTYYGYYGKFQDGPRGAAIVTVEGVRTKRCSICITQKPLDAFNRGSGPGGFRSDCRDCQTAARRK